LTRRGRLTRSITAAAVVGAALVASQVGVGTDTASAKVQAWAHEPTRQVLVLPGQTLWSIAAEVDPTADRRDVIADIVRMNGLQSSQVMAGQALELPAG